MTKQINTSTLNSLSLLKNKTASPSARNDTYCACINCSLILIMLILFPLGFCRAEELNIEIPVPPESELTAQQTMTVLGRNVQSSDYLSTQKQDRIKEYYRCFFNNQGFKNTPGKNLGEIELLRFKKEDWMKKQELVVDVVLFEDPQGTKVSIAKYLQNAGCPDIEESKLSLKDLAVTLPTEDAPGKDLKIIPRPPESVRLVSPGKEGGSVFLYASPLPVNQLKEFYRSQMRYQGWETEKESNVGEAAQAYKQAAHKKDLGLPALFGDGGNLEQVINNACVLIFKGSEGRAKITIYPNFMDNKSGSLVQIDYRGNNKL
ncbi:MAG: hypothetical protein V2A64_06240 [Candidatus Omnitrophota bacterium]